MYIILQFFRFHKFQPPVPSPRVARLGKLHVEIFPSPHEGDHRPVACVAWGIAGLVFPAHRPAHFPLCRCLLLAGDGFRQFQPRPLGQANLLRRLNPSLCRKRPHVHAHKPAVPGLPRCLLHQPPIIAQPRRLHRLIECGASAQPLLLRQRPLACRLEVLRQRPDNRLP